MIHIWSPWKLFIFQDPQPCLFICVQNSSTPWPCRSSFRQRTTRPPPPPPPLLSLQMITNQLKESIIQGWLLYIIRTFLQVSFRFQYQSIILVWLSFDFFSFSWSVTIISSSSWSYTLVCAVVQKYQEVSFIYNYSHF